MSMVIADMSMSLDASSQPQDRVDAVFAWLSKGQVMVTMPGDERTFTVDENSAGELRAAFAEVCALVCGRRLFDIAHGWRADTPSVGRCSSSPTRPDDWDYPDAPFTFVTDGAHSAVRAADLDTSLQVVASRYAVRMDTIRGRPRSLAVDAAVSRAVLDLLERVGYAAMSVEQVAVRAGVAKATVYRRWASKAEMVFGIVVHGEAIEPPADSGALAGDLRALVGHVVTLLSAPAARRALPGLLADLQRDPMLAERFQATVVQAQRAVVTRVLERAVARGEMNGRPDAPAVHAQLLGTVFAWLHLVSGAPPDDLADQITEALLAVLRAGSRQ